MKPTNSFVICSHFSLTLKNMNFYCSLVIGSCAEDLRFFCWYSVFLSINFVETEPSVSIPNERGVTSIAKHHLHHQPKPHLELQHLMQQPHQGLHSYLALCQKSLLLFLNCWNSSRTTNKNNLIYFDGFRPASERAFLHGHCPINKIQHYFIKLCSS